MGMLIDGVWREDGARRAKGGAFVRPESVFRDWVSRDGATGFEAEAGRYHLYVSAACPWAHRTLILRKLKGLDDVVSLSVVDPFMGEDGWIFSERPGCLPDTVNGARYLSEVYLAADPDVTSRVTVPVLWDRERRTIVNNESAEIIRMFNGAFDDIVDGAEDFCPEALRGDIDAINAFVYDHINNGVYKCGFARTQETYEQAFLALFAALDTIEDMLGRERYLVGGRITEADWRLFTTLVRFDAVYYGHFKCNLRRIIDYPNLSNYSRELYQVPGVAETVDMGHIKAHYYRSHESINPSRIVPLGPELDFPAPHDRDRLPAD